MEMIFKRNIASRRWYVYGKTVWRNTRRGKKLGTRKKDIKEATKICTYAITWTVKKR